MGNNQVFFKSTPLYKEYLLLEAVEKNSNITQRELSRILSVAVSMINEYLDKEEKNGYITRNYKSSKDVEYIITDKGINIKKLLNVSYLKSAQALYNTAKSNIIDFLSHVSTSAKQLILYGAGEVAEILINTINDHPNLGIKVLAVIDDNPSKVGQMILKKPIISRERIGDYDADGILISSYGEHQEIYNKLLNMNYDKNKIYHFFD